MLSSRSVKCSSDTLRASLTLRRSPLPPTPHPRLLTGIYLHIRTPPCYLSTQATAPSALPYQPDPAPLTFRSPVALLSYHPTPTHDSSAPMVPVSGGCCTGAVGRRGVCGW